MHLLESFLFIVWCFLLWVLALFNWLKSDAIKCNGLLSIMLRLMFSLTCDSNFIEYFHRYAYLWLLWKLPLWHVRLPKKVSLSPSCWYMLKICQIVTFYLESVHCHLDTFFNKCLNLWCGNCQFDTLFDFCSHCHIVIVITSLSLSLSNWVHRPAKF